MSRLEPLSLLLPFLGVMVVVATWRRGWYVGCVLSVVRRVVVSSLIPKKINKNIPMAQETPTRLLGPFFVVVGG